MKKLLTFFVILLTAALAACGNDEPESRYTRLTDLDLHYVFLLTSVYEQGEELLLRGDIARDTLTPEEVEAARTAGTIEINGKIFAHETIDVEGFMPNDRLYHAESGTEIFLVTAFFGEFEGDIIRYRMFENDAIFFKITEGYREIAANKNIPVEIWHLVSERMEWGYLTQFVHMDATAGAFLNGNYDLPEGFPFNGTLTPAFINQTCTHIRWNPKN